MSYLDEFNKHIQNKNYSSFLELWEEYCVNDKVDAEELIDILKGVKQSIFSEGFGKRVDTVIPLWEAIEDEQLAYEVLRLIFDIQTTNNPELAELACVALQKRYHDHQYFNEKLRLVGLRNKQDFRGAITNFELLNHMNKGKFVFHTGGWGTGEIMEISLVREQLILEFDLVPGKKDLSFQNAFKNLIILSDDHFLAQRFGDPDQLEQKAKQDSMQVLRLMLRDLGKKTAAEIKEELCQLVIPEEEWPKWWQGARAKLKKDPHVITPKNIKEPFILRKEALSYADRIKQQLVEAKSDRDAINIIYTFFKNHPEELKNDQLKGFLDEKVNALIESSSKELVELQLLFLKEDFLGKDFQGHERVKQILDQLKVDNLLPFIDEIEIASMKKRVLQTLQNYREDWIQIFAENVFKFTLSILADYAYKELCEEVQAKSVLQAKREELKENPTLYPESFVWYFQKFIARKKDILENPQENERKFLEALFVLLHFIEESNEDYRYLIKKVVQIVQNDQYFLIRSLIKNTSTEYLKELLLLASKCRSFNSHDLNILQSLAKVANPEMKEKSKQDDMDHVIWTTKEGYEKIKKRIENIATVETVKNAEEIKIARSHGDLRENSEYKFALEKRSRLQEELKRLSKQMAQARILSPDDISLEEVSVGMVVHIQDEEKGAQSYTLLGPWEAEPDNNILSYQSRFAQAMKGLKQGESFHYQGKEFIVKSFEPIIFQNQ